MWLLKKAQLLAKELGRKFGASAPQLFGWAEASGPPALTAFADNVLPCVLQAEGLLVLAPGLAARIARGESVSAGEAAALRAGAVVACEALAAASGATPEALDNVLWHAGKLEKYRKLPRHVDTDTLYY